MCHLNLKNYERFDYMLRTCSDSNCLRLRTFSRISHNRRSYKKLIFVLTGWPHHTEDNGIWFYMVNMVLRVFPSVLILVNFTFLSRFYDSVEKRPFFLIAVCCISLMSILCTFSWLAFSVLISGQLPTSWIGRQQGSRWRKVQSVGRHCRVVQLLFTWSTQIK